jgi:hypothetical protein
MFGIGTSIEPRSVLNPFGCQTGALAVIPLALPRIWPVKAAVSLCRRLIRGRSCPEANLANPDELVILMTLPVGVDELIIPGVLTSRDIPVHLTERYFARQGRCVEIRVPVSRLEDARRALDDAKRVGENLNSDTEV